MIAPIPSQPERRTRQRESGRTDSFLVRTWREGASEGSPRFFVRNLRTGDESYVAGLQALTELLAVHAEAGPES